MMCRADVLEGQTLTEEFIVEEEEEEEEPLAVSEHVLIGEVTVSEESSNSSYQDSTMLDTQQGGSIGTSSNSEYETICLDGVEVEDTQVQGELNSQQLGYSVDSSPPAAHTEVSFQELLNEAHYAISTGTIHNVVDNLLDTHVRTGPLPSPVVPTVYCCEICAKTFTQLWILNKHYNTAHGFSAEQSKDCKKCGKAVEPRTKHFCFKCLHCVMKFSSKSSLRDHVLVRHTQTSKKCDICSEQFPSQQLLTRHTIECKVRKGPQQETKSPLHCPKCDKVLHSFQHLKKHEQNFNSLSHTCPVCEKSFCMLYTLFTHVWGEHHKNNRTAEYTCPVCEEVFKNFRAYSYHIYDVHEGHTEDEIWKDDGRFRERKYMYSRERYLAKKNGAEKEQLSWEFEGEYNLRPDEDVELEDFARSSSRIEMLNESGAPTMLGKRKTVKLLSLPDKSRKKRTGDGGSKAKTGVKITKSKPTAKCTSKTKKKSKAKNVALNK